MGVVSELSLAYPQRRTRVSLACARWPTGENCYTSLPIASWVGCVPGSVKGQTTAAWYSLGVLSSCKRYWDYIIMM